MNLILAWLLVSHARAWEIPPRCEEALAPVAAGARQRFAGWVRLDSGADIFLRVEQPRYHQPRRWVVLFHGLLDTHRTWDEVTAELIRRGIGVARPDLRGFGRSPHARGRAPGVLPYQTHVGDFRAILGALRGLGIERPRLGAHSMAGVLALALLAEPDGPALVDPRAVILNSYVYRSEYYYFEKYSGLPVPLVQLDQLMPFGVRALMQGLTDAFVTDPHMQAQFSRHFRRQIERRGLNGPPWRVHGLTRDQVASAIASVKGLRELNALELIKRIAPEVTVDLVFSAEDEVVEAPLARQLGRLVEARGGRVIELQGGHLLPEAQPARVAELLDADDVPAKPDR